MKTDAQKEKLPKEISKIISANIKKYRLSKHLTQEQMAELLYIDTQYYAQLERGLRNFTIEKIVAVCYIFHIGIDKIIEIDSQSPEQIECEQLIKKITSNLDLLSYKQLILLERFISEIIPYIDS